MLIKKVLHGVLFLVLASALTSCTTPTPNHVDNVCSIFKQYPKWYWATQDVKKKWGVPIPVQMAIIHQESHFKSKAKPPRTHILWIIPWTRPTSAYGYTQALDMTWNNYVKKTGNSGGSRNNFADAVDFIGWYVSTAHRKLGISKNNAYALYLSYHEGMGGYKRRTYLRKRWLIKVARKVARRARTYQAQMRACRKELPEKPWWHFW